MDGDLFSSFRLISSTNASLVETHALVLRPVAAWCENRRCKKLRSNAVWSRWHYNLSQSCCNGTSLPKQRWVLEPNMDWSIDHGSYVTLLMSSIHYREISSREKSFKVRLKSEKLHYFREVWSSRRTPLGPKAPLLRLGNLHANSVSSSNPSLPHWARNSCSTEMEIK